MELFEGFVVLLLQEKERVVNQAHMNGGKEEKVRARRRCELYYCKIYYIIIMYSHALNFNFFVISFWNF